MVVTDASLGTCTRVLAPSCCWAVALMALLMGSAAAVRSLGAHLQRSRQWGHSIIPSAAAPGCGFATAHCQNRQAHLTATKKPEILTPIWDLRDCSRPDPIASQSDFGHQISDFLNLPKYWTLMFLSQTKQQLVTDINGRSPQYALPGEFPNQSDGTKSKIKIKIESDSTPSPSSLYSFRMLNVKPAEMCLCWARKWAKKIHHTLR